MKSLPFFPHPHHSVLPVLLCVLTLPCAAQAVQIGEVVALSKLGSPLRVEIALRSNENEALDKSCLSLIAPDSKAEDANSYLSRVKLTLKTEGTQQRAVISSTYAFNEAFAKFRLQVQCRGTGSISKTFTILPDMDELEAAPELALTPISNEAATPHTPPPEASKPSPAVAVIAPAEPVKPLVQKPAAPVRRATRHSLASSTKHSHEQFHLKLSGEPLDASRIGKISDADREFLLARQKLLDADDQMASFLALQHQVKQLQEELGEMKLRLAQLDAAPARISPVSAPAPAVTPVLAVASPSPPSARVWLKPAIALGTLAAAVLATLLLLRRYRRNRLEANEIKGWQDAVSDTPAEPLIITAMHIAQPAASAEPMPEPSVTSAAPVSAPVVPIAVPAPFEMADEVDSIIEEAQLYAVHNHPNKAVQILQEVLAEYPQKTEGWLLLLSIFSSQSKAQQFEESARIFLRHHHDNASWKVIQALGRTLEPDHPLYMTEDNLLNTPASNNPLSPHRRPIGDVLVEMGALSVEDMKNCLNDFDPKLHGRFGGYLVTRKVISHAQLSEALVYQQNTQPPLPTAMQHVAEPVLEYQPETSSKPREDIDFESDIDWHGIDVLIKNDKR